MELVKSLHPLLTQKGIERCEIPLIGDVNLYQLLEAIDGLSDTYVVYVNNKIIPRDRYDEITLAKDDLIIIKQNVHGGDKTSQIAAVVAAIAIAVVAPQVAPALLQGTALAGSTLAETALAAAIVAGGSLIINSLYQPTLPNASGVSNEKTSPTYSISGIRNQARIEQPIPLILGKHRVVPDLSTKFYTEWRSEKQYFYGAFTFCLNSDVSISDLKMGEDSIDNFEDVEYELSTGATGELTLFPGNVDTFTINDPCLTEQIQTTNVDTNRLVLHFGGSLVRYDDKGEAVQHNVYFRIRYREQGDVLWTNFDETGIYNIIGFSNASTKTFRQSITQVVDAGTYEVSVTRHSAEETEDRQFSEVNWVSLKGYQPDDQTRYVFQKRLGVVLQSNGSVQGNLDAINAIVESRFPIFSGGNWSTISETSNPAALLRAVALGATDGSGKRIYGGAFTTAQIDDDSIEELYDFCVTNDLKFNFVVDQNISVYDLLEMIARAGRASLDFSTGKLGVVIDQDSLPVSQIFNTGNIKKDTYQVSYVSEELNDQFVLDFPDEDNEYKAGQVVVNLPGISTPTNPLYLKIPGITNADQAGRELLLLAASQVYRNKRVSFETSLGGLVLNRGDVIRVSDDFISFDISGRLDNDYNHSTAQIKLDQPVVFQDGGTANLIVMHPDGTVDQSIVTPVGATGSPEMSDILSLSTSLSQNPSSYTGNVPQDAVYQFSKNSTPGEKLKILAMDFGYENDIKITCFPETDSYYNAEGGSFDYDLATLINTGLAEINNLQVFEQTERENGEIRVTYTWDLENAIGVNFVYTDHNGGGEGVSTEVNLGPIYARQVQLRVPRPTTMTVKLRSIPSDMSRFKATTLSDTFNIQGITTGDGEQIPRVPNVKGLQLYEKGNNDAQIGQGNDTSFTGNVAHFMWRRVGIDHPEFGEDPDHVGADSGNHDTFFKDYQVQIFNTSGDLLRTEYTTGNTYDYDLERNKLDTGLQPVREFTVEVRVRGKQSQLSQTAARLTVSNPPPEVPTGITLTPAFNSINVSFIPPTDPDYEGALVHISESSGFSPSGTQKGVGTCAFAGGDLAIFLDGLDAGTTYYVVIQPFDGFGRTGLNTSSEFSSSTVSVEFDATDIDQFNFNGLLLNVQGSPQAVIYDAFDVDYWDGTSNTNIQIPSGVLEYSGSGTDYIYLNVTNSPVELQISDTFPGVAVGRDIIASYRGGNDLVTANGGAYIDGSTLFAGTVDTAQLAAGSITADQIAASNVITTSAQIANATIQSANVDTLNGSKITAGTLGADRIITNSLTSSQIAADAITTSELAADSITAAKGQISDFAVDTLQIAGEAVTIPRSSYTSGTLGLTASYTTIQSLSITTGGARVYLSFSCVCKLTGNATTATAIEFRIVRGATPVVDFGGLLGLPPTTDYVTSGVPITYSETPASGTYTYSIQARESSVATGEVSRRSLYVAGVQR